MDGGSRRLPVGSRRIVLFGNFGEGNLGNDAQLEAMLTALRAVAAGASISCICADPELISFAYGIPAIASRLFVPGTRGPGSLAKRAWRIVAFLLTELFQWLRSLATMRGARVLIVPGTGLLTDAYTLFSWGPYDLFRWALSARLTGCRVVLTSVGAGPVYGAAGRLLIRMTLALADHRSFRDANARDVVAAFWPPAASDPLSPDLAFGLSRRPIPERREPMGNGLVVGLGVMQDAGRYGTAAPTAAAHEQYVGAFTDFAGWLLGQGHTIRLLTADRRDRPVLEEVLERLQARPGGLPAAVVAEPIATVDDLLGQIALTDVVVATRYHNVLLAMLLAKPTIAVSFHPKSPSLMGLMGVPEYGVDITELSGACLADRFSALVADQERVRRVLTAACDTMRGSLAGYNLALLAEPATAH